jgi:hypothetical protein
MTCGDCLYFKIDKGFQWYCKLEKKKIKHWGKKCKKWVSLTQKKPLERKG